MSPLLPAVGWCPLHPVWLPPGMGTQCVSHSLIPSFQLLRESSTQRGNQYLCTHQLKHTEKHFMGTGPRQMLLACLIHVAHP